VPDPRAPPELGLRPRSAHRTAAQASHLAARVRADIVRTATSARANTGPQTARR